jgi:hypothetical protein
LAKKQTLAEDKGSKPDFLDLDRDGNKKESMKKAAADKDDMDESALQAFIGKKKYGEQGMKALQQAGRDGASKQKMSKIRTQYNKMDEADMEEGNEFSGELVKARAQGAKEFNVDGKSYPVKEGAKPDYIDLDRDGNRKESMKKAAADKKKSKSAGTAFDPETARSMFSTKDEHPRYDVKDTGYSKRYTRKTEEPEDDNDSKDSQADKYASPKKKGRPKGPEKGPERVTKGSTKYKMVGGQRVKKEKTKEDLDTDGVMMNKASNMSSEGIESIALVDKGEYDREGDMAKEQLHTIKLAARELASILSDDENLPEWVQSKITKAMDYIDTARDYMISTKADREPMAEKAVSVAQRRAAGIAHAAQKGEIPKKELRGASKEMVKMPKGELKKFAKTKETGLPEKVKEADTEPKEKKSSGGFQFGKGVYESMDKRLTQALNEGMSININVDEQGKKSISVNATEEDAEALANLLKMAGMGGPGHEGSCPTCSQAPCGCAEMVDENSPDWPTNTETSDNAFQYSGGLNGPKSTGQTTVPVIASQLRRQVSMEESVKLENNLFRLYQNYKAQ